MGSLLYGGMNTEFDDRALAHLQIVIVAKLRRHEGFIFSWMNGVALGGGRSAIWLDSTCSISFRYLGNRLPEINRPWIEALIISANSAGGLFFGPEPQLQG